MRFHRAVIFANGELRDLAAARRLLDTQDLLIAADGGLEHMLRMAVLPHLLIGDLDSIDPGQVPHLEASGTEVRQYPPEKDETDLELAVLAAVQLGCQELLILGGLGGRLDHSLGNLALLTHPALEGISARLEDGLEEALIIRSRAQITGRPGDIVSLIPFQGDARGITTQGLKYPLTNETLLAYQTRGISNEMLTSAAEVGLESGLLLCIHTRSGNKRI